MIPIKVCQIWKTFFSNIFIMAGKVALNRKTALIYFKPINYNFKNFDVKYNKTNISTNCKKRQNLGHISLLKWI